MDRRGLLALAAAMPFAGRSELHVDPAGGAGRLRTLGEALAVAAPGTTIRLAPGVFEEKLTVRVPGLTIVGSGPGSVIRFGDAAGTLTPAGTPIGTGGSASLTIAAPGVTLRNVTVRNGFDYIGARRDQGAQAVALLIAREADRCSIADCAIEGYQDTLYVQARSRFSRCRIAGTVDFVFGGGAAWFEACRIVTRRVPESASAGYLAAPSTPADQRFGLVFDRCRVEREAGVPDRSAWLGRPWRAGGDMRLLGQAAFLHCWMDAHIRREGWTSMGYRAADGSRVMLAPEQARLFEYASRGPGAAPAGTTRRLLDRAAARAFTERAVLGGWR